MPRKRKTQQNEPNKLAQGTPPVAPQAQEPPPPPPKRATISEDEIEVAQIGAQDVKGAFDRYAIRYRTLILIELRRLIVKDMARVLHEPEDKIDAELREREGAYLAAIADGTVPDPQRKEAEALRWI